MFKKCLLLSACLLATTASQAAAFATCSEGHATVPCNHQDWEFGADLLYLRADDSTIGVNRGNVVNDWQPDFGFGFRLNGAYHFAAGKDLSLSWTHFKKTTSKNALLTDEDATTQAFVPVVDESKLNMVQLRLGQKIDVGDAFDLHVNAGVMVAHADNNIQINGPDDATNYRGIGPTVGLDSSYQLTQNAGVFANFTFGLLYTKILTANIEQVLLESYGNDLYTEIQLGVECQRQLAGGNVEARLGWQIMQFDSALVADVDRRHSWGGAFLGATWHGNA